MDQGWGVTFTTEKETFHKYGKWEPLENNLHINVKETIVILKAVMFLKLKDITITTLSDSKTAISVVRKRGSSKNPLLHRLVTALQHYLVEKHLSLNIQHVPEKRNISADLLSRKKTLFPAEMSMSQKTFTKLISKLDFIPETDVFSNGRNVKLPKCFTSVPFQKHPLDAFLQNWEIH